MGYTPSPVEYTVVQSGTFRRWLRKLRDRRARARIIVRIERAVVILLCGGDKSGQQRDIERGRRMAGEL